MPNLLACIMDHLPLDSDEKDNISIQLLPESMFINTIDASLMDRLSISSSVDPVVHTTLKAFTNPETPPPLCSALSNLKLSDRILLYKGLTYVLPSKIRHELTSFHYNSPITGHPGHFKT